MSDLQNNLSNHNFSNNATQVSRPRANSFDKPEKRSRAYSLDLSHVHSLTLGAEVVIRPTESVVQRTPNLVGKIGYVKEVPVHPATWFKVSFPDDASTHTFRPSALRLSSQPEEEMVQCTPYRLIKQQPKVVTEKQVQPSPQSEVREGVSVLIVKGRFSGCSGKVSRTTKGWVQLETNKHGEISVRISDVEICSDNSVSNSFEEKPVSARTSRSIKPNRLYSEANELDEASTDSNGGSLTTRKSKGAFKTVISNKKPRVYSDEVPDCPLPIDSGFEIPDNWKDLNLPLVNINITKAKRLFLKKFVERKIESIKSRPDLTKFLYRISQAIYCDTPQSDYSTPPKNKCFACNQEKWIGGKYCWNAACSETPTLTKAKVVKRAKKSKIGLSYNEKSTIPANDLQEQITKAFGNIDASSTLQFRPRGDSLSLTDSEMRTPERNLSEADLTKKY